MVDLIFTQIIFTGVCNGIGTATGSYLATRYAIKHIPIIEETIKRKVKP